MMRVKHRLKKMYFGFINSRNVLILTLFALLPLNISSCSHQKPAQGLSNAKEESSSMGDTLDPSAQKENLELGLSGDENNTLQPELVFHQGHEGSIITSVAFSPNEPYVLSGDGDGMLRLWNERTGKYFKTLTGHTGAVTSVAFSRDGRYIVSGSQDKTLRLWEVKTGQSIRVFTGHAVTSVAFSPDGHHVLSGSLDKTLRLWEIETGETVRTFKGHKGAVTSVAFSPNGHYVLSGSKDTTLRLWETDTGETVHIFTGHKVAVRSVAFSPDGRYVLSTTPLRLWNVETGQKVHDFTRLIDDVSVDSAVFSPDGRHIVSGHRDFTIRLWDVSTGQKIRVFESFYTVSSVFTYNFTPFAVSPDGLYVLSASQGKALRLLEVETGKEVRVFQDSIDQDSINLGYSADDYSLTFSPDGFYVLSARRYGKSRLWNVATGRVVLVFPRNGPSSSTTIFSPDGHYVLSRSGDQTLRLWKVETGEQIPLFPMHTDYVTSVAFSPNGHHILSGSEDKTLRLWKVETGETVRTFKGHAHAATLVAFSPDRRYVLSTTSRFMSSFRLWNVETGQKVRDFTPLIDDVLYDLPVFSPDGRHILSRSLMNSMRLWKVETGEQIRLSLGSTHDVKSMAFSYDGLYVLAGHRNNTISLWEVETGKQIRLFVGHTGAVMSVAFSPDGRYALSGSMDKTLRLWVAKTGETVHIFQGHEKGIHSAAFSPDGRYVVSGSEYNRIRLWHVETGKEIATLTSVAQTDYITMLSDNYYAASRGTLKQISFKVGDQVFPFEQFDLKLNRPDIVLERLGKASPATIATYRRLYQKRLKKMGFTEEMLSLDFHVPEVSIQPKEFTLSTRSKTLTFKIRASDSKYSLDRINVYINDVPIYGVDGISLRSQQKQPVEREIKVQLTNGNNKIQVSVLNEKGTESLKETFSIVYTGIPAKPDVYLVAIGVSKYQLGVQNPNYNLWYAAKDAIDFASLYQNEIVKSGNYGKVNVLTITDEKAIRENIIKAKEFFKQSKVDDLVILYISGHGLVSNELDYYFATHDIDLKNPRERGLLYGELEDLLDGIPSLQKLLLMDTCFSGEIDKTETEVIVPDAMSTQALRGLQVKARVFINKRDFKVTPGVSKNSIQFQADLFANLRRDTGTTIITSSSGDEISVEGILGQTNGVFTYCLIKGLKTKAADSNQDGNISVSELQEYVIDQVRVLTNGRQNPTVRRENLENDFQVAF